MPLQHPNADLVGRPVEDLSTPFLMIDLQQLEANIDAMARHCARAGIALRPHAKTHKSAEIARRQMRAGAVGICVAKLGEAEALWAEGIGDILITSPVVGRAALARLVRLALAMPGLRVVVDSAPGLEALAGAASAAGVRVSVLIDLDVGLHRTGVPPEGALALGEAAARLPALKLGGIQAYAGQVMHIENADERREKAQSVMAIVRATRDAFAAKGLPTGIVTGGGTGTFDLDVEGGVLSELQCGSYVFMDHQYNIVRQPNAAPWLFKPSLFVVTSVISANHPGLATTDAGLKSFATDAGPPQIAVGAPDGARYFFFGDEQGGIAYADKSTRASLGDRVSCVVPHCDPTVNLYDVYHVVADGRLIALWPIEGRGRGL